MPRRWHLAATTAFGLATAGFGAALLRDPDVLLRPPAIAGGEHDGRRTRVLARAAGARDIASGLVLVAAALGGRPDRLRAALTARAVGDLTDVVWTLVAAPAPRKPLAAGLAATGAAVALLLRRTVGTA